MDVASTQHAAAAADAAAAGISVGLAAPVSQTLWSVTAGNDTPYVIRSMLLNCREGKHYVMAQTSSKIQLLLAIAAVTLTLTLTLTGHAP